MRAPFSAGLGLLLLFLLAAPAWSQVLSPGVQPPAAPIVRALVADVDFVRNQADATRELNVWFDVQRNRLNQEVQEEEVALRQAQETLLAQEDSMEPEAFRAENEVLSRAFLELGVRVREERARLNEELAANRQGIEAAMRQVFVEILTERRATFLFEKRFVLINIQAADVTEEALARLNLLLPTLGLIAEVPEGQDVETPQAEAPSGSEGDSSR